MGDEEDIGIDRQAFRSRASRVTFSYRTNAIGPAVAYAAAVQTHLSVHCTARPPGACAVDTCALEADCLIHSAVDISNPCQWGLSCAAIPVASGVVRGVSANTNVRANADIVNGHTVLGTSAVVMKSATRGADAGDVDDDRKNCE